MGKGQNIIFRAMHQQISQDQREIMYPELVSISSLTIYLISFNALINIHGQKIYSTTPRYQAMHQQISQDQRDIYWPE